MKTAFFYDSNSRDSLASALLYQLYINYSVSVNDVFVPFDGSATIVFTVDPQTAAAYDRYIFLEVPPDAGSLATLLTNGKTVVIFQYTQPVDWSAWAGASVIVTGPSITIAATFMDWLFTDVDSYSFSVYVGHGLLNVINNWELYCRYYMDANSLKKAYEQAANYLSYVLKTNTTASANWDPKSDFIGFVTFNNSLADAGNAFAGLWSKTVVDGENTYSLKRMNIAGEQIQLVDRIMTHRYLAPLVEDSGNYVEYYEIGPDANSNPIVSVCLKPIALVLAPLYNRSNPTSLLGLDQYNAITAIVTDYYTPLGITLNKWNWDGSYSFNIQMDKYFPPSPQ